MPLASVRVRMDRTTVNADAVYWEWAVDGAEYDDTDGLALVNATLGGIEAAVSVSGSAQLAGMSADLIECFPGAGGPAYYVQGLAPGLPVGTGSSIHVVQCVVNELIASPRGTAVGGRMFVGPLATAAIQGDGTISMGAEALCVDVMQEVAAAHIAAGFTPVVISRVSNKVERPTPIGQEVIGFRADRRLDILVSRRVDAPQTTADYPLLPEA